MSVYLRYSLMLAALLASSGSSVAQEEAEFGGTWDIVFTGEVPQGRCGTELTYAELQVTGQVSDTKWPTYEAMVTAWISTQRCLEIVKETSKARLVVRGTRVSLSYENEDWGAEMLVRDLQAELADTVLHTQRLDPDPLGEIHAGPPCVCDA